MTQMKAYATSWEKEKIVVTSIFSFSYNVFCSFKIKIQIFSLVYFVASNGFKLNQSNFFNLMKEVEYFGLLAAKNL